MDKKDVITGFIINAALLVLGLVMLLTPITGLSQLVIIFAAVLIIYGVIMLLQYLKSRQTQEKSSLLPTILSFAIGILLLIFHQFAGDIILPLLIGLWSIANGIYTLVNAFGLKKQGSSVWLLPVILGLIYLILGIIVACNLFALKGAVSSLSGVLLIIIGFIGLVWSLILVSLRKKHN